DDPLATQGTWAKGINASGQIVGYYRDEVGYHAFLYSNGSYLTLDDPSAANGTFAQGINDLGQIVGYYSDSSFNSHPFIGDPVPVSITWISIADGSWNDSSNWSTGTVPGRTDNAVLSGGSPYTVTIVTSVTANSLACSNGATAVVSGGGSLTLINGIEAGAA